MMMSAGAGASYGVIDHDRRNSAAPTYSRPGLARATHRSDRSAEGAPALTGFVPYTRAIIGNKATANQPPLLKLFYKESGSNERLRVGNWIVQRLV